MAGVVLDYDGVLARSMELHAEAYRRVLAPLGARVQDRDVFLLEGPRSETILRNLLDRNHVPVDPKELRRLADLKQLEFERLGPARLYPGAKQLVQVVRERVASLALVTGTRRVNLERAIPRLLPCFDAILAQDAYQHDKPHPEPYLKAAEALGLAPGDCAALENAPRGIRSARGAGYGYVVAIGTTLPGEILLESTPHVVVPDHAAAARTLCDWLQRRAKDVAPEPRD